MDVADYGPNTDACVAHQREEISYAGMDVWTHGVNAQQFIQHPILDPVVELGGRDYIQFNVLGLFKEGQRQYFPNLVKSGTRQLILIGLLHGGVLPDRSITIGFGFCRYPDNDDWQVYVGIAPTGGATALYDDFVNGVGPWGNRPLAATYGVFSANATPTIGLDHPRARNNVSIGLTLTISGADEVTLAGASTLPVSCETDSLSLFTGKEFDRCELGCVADDLQVESIGGLSFMPVTYSP